MPDGSFFISDEYGPYIYRFSATGRMLGAIRPPDALIPIRKGQQNFSSNNPGPGGSAPVPPNPETGRQNNQGFEGMTLLPDGRTLAVILQSATRQDGGTSAATREHTRMLFYDVSDPAQPKLRAAYRGAAADSPMPKASAASRRRVNCWRSTMTAFCCCAATA